MKLLGINIKDFLSMKDVTIEFPTGIVSVIGHNRDVYGASSNGSGKSSLFDAISWALFGKTLRPIGTDDVIRRGSEQAHVAVLVKINGREYSIERRRGKKTDLKIWAYDPEEEMTAATVQMTQVLVDNLIGVDFKTFLSIATFDLDVLRFARATDKEQKEILERLLDLDLYNRGLEKVRKEINEKEKSLQTINDNIGFIKNNLKQMETQKIDLHQKLKQQESLTAIHESSSASKIKNFKELIAAEESKITINDLDLKKPSPMVPSEDKTFAMNMLAGQMREKELQRRISDLQTKVFLKDKELLTVEARIGKPCGECHRPITQKELSAVMESIANDNIRMMEEEADVRTQLINQQVVTKNSTKLHDDYMASRKEFDKAIKDWNSIVVNARVGNENSRKLIHKYQSEISMIEAERVNMKANDEKWRVLLVDLENRITKANLELKDKEDQITLVTDGLGFLKFWEKGFGYQGIRSVLLDDVAATITKKANEYLKHLMGGSLWIDCHTQSTTKDGEKREKFEVQTFNSFGAGTYFGNSKGEQQRIDIALSLALHDIARQRSNKPLGFCIFDEVFERLDEVGCDSIVSLLHKERANMGTVFVVSHNPNISQRFPNCIEFVKKGGITSLAKDLSCEESKPELDTMNTTKSSAHSRETTPVRRRKSQETGTMTGKATSKSL